MRSKKRERDHVQMEKRRMKAARIFARGLGASEAARQLGVTRQSAHDWKKQWERAGRDGLRSKGAAGRKARLSEQQKEQVIEALLAGPESFGYRTAVWTLPRVAGLIEQLTAQQYHPGHVWHLLQGFGFSCQRPSRRAIERDEKAIAHWKRYRWPHIKKGSGRAAHYRLHRRERA